MKITEINATIVPGINIQRVAAYARVSTEKEYALHSVSAQISYYNEYIGNHPGWELVEIYADEGISGTVDSRPEFQRMLADCRAGKIDMIITKAVSRFARNNVTFLEVIRELRSLGVDVYFENEKLHSISPGGDLMIRLLAMMAEEYSRSASENQKWRIKKMFEEGRPNTGRMLGYYLKDGQLTIISEEADIVRQIFHDYLSGMGRLAIAKKLNAEGIKTIWGNEWREGNIYRILHNEKYTGDMILQKTFVENFRTKKGRINKGERPKYFVENSHQAIISKEMFEATQEEIARRQSRRIIPEQSEKTQFSSLITCADCGKHFRRRVANASTKYAKPAWICSTFVTKGKDVCNMKQIPESILITKTCEALQLNTLDGINLRTYLNEIICDRNQITFKMNTGESIMLPWESLSRKYSWTNKMKQEARIKTRERYGKHGAE